MQFKELKTFSSKIDALKAHEDLAELQNELVENPEKGDPIPELEAPVKCAWGFQTAVNAVEPESSTTS